MTHFRGLLQKNNNIFARAKKRLKMADISMFATKDKADEGVIFPVVLEGMKLPMAVKLYGDDSDVVHEYNKERLRNLKVGKNGAEIDEEMMEELLDSNENILIRIGGVYSYDLKKKEVVDEPLILFGKELKCDRKSYSFLVEKIPAFKDFVLEKSQERKNFLDGGKKD